MAAGQHIEREDHPWTIAIPDHVGRTDSPEYVKSRATMNQIAATIAAEQTGLFYGAGPWQDHHGGALLVKDDQGWFLVRNLVGMEWSSQFCADPAKVDKLRLNARRVYARFPEAAQELGIQDLLDHEIKTPADVEQWVDSICNASVPLPAGLHTGILPQGGGVHHYPAPIVEIALFKHDDFKLWVLDPQGQPAAVTPMSQPGSGDGRVQVQYSTPGTELNHQHVQASLRGDPMVLPDNHTMARQAFHRQYEKIAAAKPQPSTKVLAPTPPPVTEAIAPDPALIKGGTR
ncbi:MAG: DUF6424 family protein [Candidatus Dormibacteraeota bacterium]|nr:DUF6424 family protein [Candidatus Dormibacteraeota bacterium]